MLLTPPPRFSLNTTLILGPALQIVIVKNLNLPIFINIDFKNYFLWSYQGSLKSITKVKSTLVKIDKEKPKRGFYSSHSIAGYLI